MRGAGQALAPARPRGAGSRLVGGVLLALAPVSPTAVAAAAQEDSVTVVAGPRYSAGPMQRAVLGSGYRDIWLTPIRVPVLRPDTFAGGLTVLRRGASSQTLNLRLRGANGREYVFRAVDKEQHPGLPRDLQHTMAGDVIQDRVSAKHPGAALVVAPLLEAAGVLHARPTLAVMADHPRLGEDRETFAGMLGTIEEYPDEEGGVESFGGFNRIIGTERLLERLRESPRDRIDALAYLAARLMDVLVGDWDRHPDQWRWAQIERDGTRYWLPIPRDRDNAFSHIDGLLARGADMIRPNIMEYRGEYENLYGLIHNAQPLDRPLLAELPLAAWDSVAHVLRTRLTDDAIIAAVAALPRAWAVLEAEPLARKLRARRDALPEVARTLYRMMALDVDVHATDSADRADLERLADGSLMVRILEAGTGAAYFERRFLPEETREVRVHLHGSADSALVHGPGRGLKVRIIGGAGDDLMWDASAPGSALTAFYDVEGVNRFLTARGTRVDRRSYEPPPPSELAEGNAPPRRDWGGRRSKFSGEARWGGRLGPVIGGGPARTRYGFRRVPYASRQSVTLLVAPLFGRFALEAESRHLPTGGGGDVRLRARTTQLESTRFYGFGNESASTVSSALRRVWETRYTLTADLLVEPGGGLELLARPLLEVVDPEAREGSPAVGVPGSRTFGVGGIHTRVVLDRRAPGGYTRRGVHLRGEVAGLPLVWGDAPEPFARAGGTAAAYLPLPGPYEPTLALRAGADRVYGRAPFQHAAFLGGSGRLRGYPSERFAGEAVLHGTAELRAAFGRADFRIVKGELGGIGFLDAGRVFVREEVSDRWHAGYGGGLWYAALDRAVVAHLLYAYGERHSLYLGLGMPF